MHTPNSKLDTDSAHILSTEHIRLQFARYSQLPAQTIVAALFCPRAMKSAQGAFGRRSVNADKVRIARDAPRLAQACEVRLGRG